MVGGTAVVEVVEELVVVTSLVVVGACVVGGAVVVGATVVGAAVVLVLVDDVSSGICKFHPILGMAELEVEAARLLNS